MDARPDAAPRPYIPPSRLVVFGAWTALGLFYVSREAIRMTVDGDPSQLPARAALSFLDVWVWALFTFLVFRVAARFPFTRRTVVGPLAAHLAAGSVLSVAAVAINWTVAVRVLPGMSGFLANLRWFFHSNLQWYAGVLVAAVLTDYYRRWRERQTRAARLQAQLAEARLDALGARVRPGFVFGTLDSVSAVMRQDPDLADRMMVQLAILMRASLESSAAEAAPLHEELRVARAYLQLEQARLRGRLATSIEADEAAQEAAVPRTVLLPLLEAAVRHVAEADRSGRVDLRITIRGDRLRVEVAVQGVAGEMELPDGIPERLEQLYGADHRLESRAGPDGGAATVLEIPFDVHYEAGALACAAHPLSPESDAGPPSPP